jgi:hypothetical protein
MLLLRGMDPIARSLGHIVEVTVLPSVSYLSISIPSAK